MVVGSLTFFDLIFVLTAGGPGDSTRVLALDMYRRGFGANQMGPASVIAVILVLVGLAIALGLRRLGGDNEESQREGIWGDRSSRCAGRPAGRAGQARTIAVTGPRVWRPQLAG